MRMKTLDCAAGKLVKRSLTLLFVLPVNFALLPLNLVARRAHKA